MKIDKKVANTAVFFSILYWLAVYFLAIKNKVVVSRLSGVAWLVIIGIYGVVVLCSTFLEPVFEWVLKVTGWMGSLIFGIVTTVVYYFILTPIALVKRVMGKPLMRVRIDKSCSSYYEDWEPSESVEKQF